MKKISQLLTLFLCVIILITIVFHIKEITKFLIPYIENEPKIEIPPTNEYAKKDTFTFVHSTDQFIPYSKMDLQNIFYTIVNNGWEKFTFYCPKEYTKCLEDIKTLSQNQDLLTHLNNFVHPFNEFSNVKTAINESGEVTVTITYLYSKEKIKKINEKIKEILKEQTTSDMDLETKILTIHDYIINTTKYDVKRNNEQESQYDSYTAYGPLFEGYATCNGYTDAMALFLTKLNVPNFKVAMTPENENEEGHVWNALYLNNKWVHLDLTWDDPVSKDGKDYLQHKYFLVTTAQLKEADSGEVKVEEHQFKTNIYIELKEK